MTTNAKVLFRTEFLRQQEKWCRYTVERLVTFDDIEEITTDHKSQRYSLVQWLFAQTMKTADPSLDIGMLAALATTNLAASCPLIWNDTIPLSLARSVARCRSLIPSVALLKDDGSKTMPSRPVTYAKLANENANYVYARWMWTMLRDIETHNARTDKESLGGRDRRLFSLLPVASRDRIYIHLSSTALAYYLSRHRHVTEQQDSHLFNALTDLRSLTRAQAQKYVYDRKQEFWDHCFDIKRAFGTRRNRAFDFSINTDGIGASVLFASTNAAKRTAAKKEEQERRRNERRVVDLEREDTGASGSVPTIPFGEKFVGARVIAVDPGKRDVYCAVEHVDGLTKEHVKQYSGRRYEHESGRNKAQWLREQWANQQSAEYHAWLKFMPTHRVTTVAKFQEYVTYLFQRLDECFAVNGDKRVRNLRFTNYMKRQKAMTTMCNELLAALPARASERDGDEEGDDDTEEEDGSEKDDDAEEEEVDEYDSDDFPAEESVDEQSDEPPAEQVESALGAMNDNIATRPVVEQQHKKKIVVVFGKASFVSIGPVKGLRKALSYRRNVTLVHMDEFKTSKVASCCQNEECLIAPLGPRIEGAAHRARLHGVRVCSNCRMTWNRDVNAARNMLHLFEYAQEHSGMRDPVFCRPVAAKADSAGRAKGRKRSSPSGSTSVVGDGAKQAKQPPPKRIFVRPRGKNTNKQGSPGAANF